jgi:hypothetical protein
MKKFILFIVFTVISLGAIAQEEEEGPTSYSYATYYYCDVTGQERADEIVKEIEAPVYDQAVKDGLITGWGWLAHHTGGKWRRIQYYAAPSLDALLDAQEAIAKSLDGNEAAQTELGKICNAHDDYIWASEVGSSGGSRGPAAFSVYYICDEKREDRADEIMKNDFAPIFDKFVAEGKLVSWGWLSHWVGGKYRKLQTMTASDHKSLLKTRNELIAALYPEDGEAGAEFTDICGSHADYMLDIQLETP